MEGKHHWWFWAETLTPLPQGYLPVPRPSICKTSVWTQFNCDCRTTTLDPHKVVAVREYLDAEKVVQLPLISSSDMNPIEHVWDALDQAINNSEVILQNLLDLIERMGRYAC